MFFLCPNIKARTLKKEQKITSHCNTSIDIILLVYMFVENQLNIFVFTADESNTTEFLWNCSFRREGKDEGKVCNRIQVKKRTVFSSDKNIDPDP